MTQQIIDLINTAIYTEEKAIPLYEQHLSTTLQFSGLEKSDIKQIQNILKFLKKDSLKHLKALEAVKRKMIKEEDR
jgi:rubrerythrin